MKKLLLILTLLAPMAVADSIDDLDDHIADCDRGDQKACLAGTRVSQAYYKHDLMVTFIRKGCALGNNISCSDLGIFKLMGNYVDLDVKGGAKLVKQGCENGYFRACGNLGWMYYTGSGVAKNNTKAVRFYGEGCDGGSSSACSNLGKMYDAGDGVRKDRARAKALFERACEIEGC